MIEGKTSTGFKFSYDERLLTDWRIMEAISTADSPDNIKMVKGTTDLINFLLGDNKDGLMEHIKKSNDGFIPVDKLRKELFEILGASKESKN
ncbi:MAG: hypothetical protein IJH64_10180 [Oscillospiraceae bacterium]|jgi:hypothetical protein|nr:hypothetical protein [Oscillospiraceae bacterium]